MSHSASSTTTVYACIAVLMMLGYLSGVVTVTTEEILILPQRTGMNMPAQPSQVNARGGASLDKNVNIFSNGGGNNLNNLHVENPRTGSNIGPSPSILDGKSAIGDGSGSGKSGSAISRKRGRSGSSSGRRRRIGRRG